ncbi:substrate binding domain-containing protein, partial [Pseudomonas oryzihabitans]
QLLTAAGAALDSGLQHREEPRGQVRLAMPKAVGYRLIAPLLPDFFQRYPDVDLQLRLDDRPLDPIADDQDLLVRITEQPPAGFVARPLREMDFVLCASPTYLRRHGLPQQPQALAEHECLYLGETPGDQRWQLRRGDRVESVTVRGRLACNHSGVRLEATLA